MVAGEAGNLVAQMRRGVLPYCVLAMLRQKEWYGFELVHAMGSIDGMVTGEGTLYPLLARLRRQGLVETNWQEALADFAGSWRQLRDSVDELLASSPEDPMPKAAPPEQAPG